VDIHDVPEQEDIAVGFFEPVEKTLSNHLDSTRGGPRRRALSIIVVVAAVETELELPLVPDPVSWSAARIDHQSEEIGPRSSGI
jgi:hypothetical protein